MLAIPIYKTHFKRTGNTILPNIPNDSLNLGTGSYTGAGLIGSFLRPSGDTTTAIQLQNSAGVNILNVDSVNKRIGINLTNPSVTFEINGTLKSNEIKFVGYDTYLGFSAGQYNTGNYFTGTGYYVGFNNTGNGFTGTGYYAGTNNTGVNFTGTGYYVGINNTGVNFTGTGYNVGTNNTGNYFTGTGAYVGFNNTGNYFTGTGYYAGINNTGNYFTGTGAYAGVYNEGNYNTVLGAEAFNTFNLDTANEKSFNFDDIDPATEYITILNHGFGTAGTKRNLKFTQGTSPITGMTNGTVYRFEVVDADTLKFVGNITDAGTGTGHLLTPQKIYTNSTALGYNAEPFQNNMFQLGDANITLVNTSGDYEVSVKGRGLIVKDTVSSQRYRITVTSGVVTAVAL